MNKFSEKHLLSDISKKQTVKIQKKLEKYSVFTGKQLLSSLQIIGMLKLF